MYSKNKVDLKNYRVIVNEQNETDYFAAKELTKYFFFGDGGGFARKHRKRGI